MSNKTKIISSIGIGTIVIIVTLVIFLIGFSNKEKAAIDWIALVFILVSEIALFGGLIALRIYKTSMNENLIRTGIISTLFIYWLVVTVISIFSKGLYGENIGGFVTTQIIICGLAAIIVISLSLHAANVKAKDEKILNVRVLLQEIENMVFLLKSNTDYVCLRDSLNKLYEELKYSDKTTSVESMDKAINEKVVELSNGLIRSKSHIANEDIENRVNQIILNIKERNMAAMQSKRGGF